MRREWYEIRPDEVDGAWLDGLADRNAFQRASWIRFLEETQGVVPFYAGFGHVGQPPAVFFTGLVKSIGGMRIIGSPALGWTTSYMGFNVADPELFETAMLAFVPFVLSRPRVVHLELRDDRICRELADRMGLEAKTSGTWRTDLRPSEDDIIAGFNQSKRRNTRLAERRGVTISEADDLDFASDYYNQLIDVFAKQNLTPTYDEERVRAMMRLVQPAGDLLCLRARDEDGLCIASAIYVFHGTKSVFWGNASWREHQKLFPNEALHWYAMRWLKKAGVEEHEWGGGGDYKKGYGGAPVVVEGYSASRHALLKHGRVAAERAFYGSREISARIKARLAP